MQIFFSNKLTSPFFSPWKSLNVTCKANNNVLTENAQQSCVDREVSFKRIKRGKVGWPLYALISGPESYSNTQLPYADVLENGVKSAGVSKVLRIFHAQRDFVAKWLTIRVVRTQ